VRHLFDIHGIDPLTVAAQTGNLRFIPSAMREKLATVIESM
jgi:hypothetical protein